MIKKTNKCVPTLPKYFRPFTRNTLIYMFGITLNFNLPTCLHLLDSILIVYFCSKPFAHVNFFLFVAGAPVTRAVSQPSERERKDSVQSVSEMSENGSQVFLRFLGSSKTS